MSCTNTRRYFTEAAREAAAVARRRKRELREQSPEQHELAMVVVRASDPPTGYGWQIRRFGHVLPVAESARPFGDAREAERSGAAALEAMRNNPVR